MLGWPICCAYSDQFYFPVLEMTFNPVCVTISQGLHINHCLRCVSSYSCHTYTCQVSWMPKRVFKKCWTSGRETDTGVFVLVCPWLNHPCLAWTWCLGFLLCGLYVCVWTTAGSMIEGSWGTARRLESGFLHWFDGLCHLERETKTSRDATRDLGELGSGCCVGRLSVFMCCITRKSVMAV